MPIYTDDFTGASGDLTAPWVQARTVSTRTMQRDGSGHGRAQNPNVDALASYNNTIGNDQYTQIVPQWNGTGTASDYVYLAVRAPSSAAWWDNSTAFYLFWSDGGSDTQVLWTTTGSVGLTALDTANTFTYASGDVIKFQVVGSVLKVFKNGVAITWTMSGTTSVTDAGAHVASGFPGIGLFISNISTRQIDLWEGGDFSTGDTQEWMHRQSAQQGPRIRNVMY